MDQKQKNAFQKGLNWMLQHPQMIEEDTQLYANELMFYHIMTEKSKTAEEREFFKGIFLERLRQSDGFNFKVPTSIHETCSYVAILGYRKCSRKWEPRDTETDSKLLYYIKEDIRKHINLYEGCYPHELKFIYFRSRRFNIELNMPYKSNFKWWVFLGVEDKLREKSSHGTGLDFYEVFVAYHVTHVILIDSDWGLRYLDKGDYAREHRYILTNMQKFIHNRHIDLVSELIICLKILKATDNILYREGVGCILKNQDKDGSWPPYIYSFSNKHTTALSTKHTTIVALWALRNS